MKQHLCHNLKKINHMIWILSALMFTLSLGLFGYVLSDSLRQTQMMRKTRAVTEHKNKNVLMISAYSPTHPNLLPQQSGVDAVFYENDIVYDIVYMYTREYGVKEAQEKFYREMQFREEHIEKKYDAILAADDNALQFVMNYRSEFFGTLPVVFLGINDVDLAKTAVNMGNMTGVLEQADISKTIHLAKTIMPYAKSVVGICDNTATGRGIAKSFDQAQKEFPDLSFEHLNASEMTKGEIVQALSGLPRETILLYMMMSEDETGNPYTVQGAMRLIVGASPVPVFRNFTGGQDEGAIGGVCMDMTKAGSRAAELVVRILSGESADQIPLVTDIPDLASLNDEVVQAYDLNDRLIPEEVEVWNRPGDDLSEYRRIMMPVCLMILALLGFMLRERLRYQESLENEKALMETTESLRTSREDLKYQVEHDYLTKLNNRQTAVSYLDSILSFGSKYAVALIDVDNFKDINETYGHSVGDEILVRLADRLEELAERNRYYAARYGGDEFLVMFPEVHLTEGSAEVEELLHIFRIPVEVGMEMILPNASLGIANSDQMTSAEQLIIKANLALNEAKNNGKNTCVFFTSDMKQDVSSANRMKAKVFEAINHDGFYMVYQPKVSAADLTVTGFEALVRMKNSELSPGLFIPIAERNGWIRRIGRMTTMMTVRQLAKWRDEGYELHPVSINFSSNQIYDTGYLDFLLDLLAQYHLSTDLIEIEITESLYVDRTRYAMALFERFEAAGIRLLMDDFGTGYSSLSYLSYIPVDVIKLDKSLVDNYLSPGKDTFIHDVIRLGHDLGKKIIIEGVEEAWQYERLCEFGGDIIQGYFFSKPLLPEDAIRYRPKLK